MSERWQVTKMGYSHEALVDQIIANPTATNTELGNIFGRTAQWVSLVKCSGMFREAYAKRVTDLADPLLIQTLDERLDMLTNRSLEILTEKLSRPAQDIPDDLAIQAAQFGAKAKGLGGFSSRPPPAPETPMVDRVERLAARLLNLNRQGAVDVEARMLPQASEAASHASSGG